VPLSVLTATTLLVSDFVPAPPRLHPYDPAWATAYRTEATLLDTALVHVPHWIEHIGSTAVPGLLAKPVIDVMVGVTDYDRFDEIRRALMGQAYEWDPAAERDEPTRKVFRKGPRDYTQLRTHHLHLTVKDGDYWRRILAFRDQLRQDPNAAAQYGAVKRSLLGTCGGDSRAYTRGKHDVVKKIERAAVSTFPTQTCAPEVPLHPPERATASGSAYGDGRFGGRGQRPYRLPFGIRSVFVCGERFERC